MPSVWFIYHVAKTGGQTIRNHLRGQLGSSGHLHVGRWDLGDPVIDRDAIATRDLTRVRAVTGHRVTRALAPAFGGRTVREALVLRHPAERIVSQWRFRNHRRRREGHGALTFGDFCASMGRDPMVHSVARIIEERDRPRRRLDAVLHALTTMEVVTVLEDLDIVLPHLLSAIGIRPELPPRANRAGVDFAADDPPDPEDVEDWLARNSGDLILYRAARDRTGPTLRRLSEIEG